MTIAVHLSDSENHHAVFLYKCFQVLVEKHRDHRFVFFSTTGIPVFPGHDNCRTVKITPPIKNKILLHYWYNFKLPALLNKYNAVVFINEDSIASLKTTVRHLMVLKNFRNMEYYVGGKSSLYANRYFKSFLHKASSLLCTSGYIAGAVAKHFPITHDKISMIGHGLSASYKILDYSKRDSIQNDVSGGHAYFFAEVSPETKENVLVILKAFSIFKKWHKSSMKLMLVYKDDMTQFPVENFKSYKYREDVILYPHNGIENLAEIMGAAYAVVYLPAKYSAGLTGYHALKCGVPLIACDSDFCRSQFADAAVFAKPLEQDLGEKMAKVYKDENFCKMQVAKGLELVQHFSWENTAMLLWSELTTE